MRLEEICDNARALATKHGWSDTVDERMLHLTSELGEVANALLTLRAASLDEDVLAARTALGHEIFDAIWNLCALANLTGINLDAAAAEKVQINASREWPPNPKRPDGSL